jgi:uncharacterized membrane protein
MIILREGAKIMNALLKVGRFLFAIAMAGFGVEFFIFGTSMAGPIPGPPWTHDVLFLSWLACAGFILAAMSIVTGRWARSAAALLGIALFLYTLHRHIPVLVTHLHNPNPWTVVFEILAMSGGAWVLAGSLPKNGQNSPWRDSALARMADAGSFLIGISLLVFAVQHFMYARFVATLIPAWIPARLFWAYFTGAAFVAAAISIAIKKKVRLAGTLLGTMFLLWVVLLHAPRVAAAPRNGAEVTSLFVALAMSGVGFALASRAGARA